VFVRNRCACLLRITSWGCSLIHNGLEHFAIAQRASRFISGIQQNRRRSCTQRPVRYAVALAARGRRRRGESHSVATPFSFRRNSLFTAIFAEGVQWISLDVGAILTPDISLYATLTFVNRPTRLTAPMDLSWKLVPPKSVGEPKRAFERGTRITRPAVWPDSTVSSTYV